MEGGGGQSPAASVHRSASRRSASGTGVYPSGCDVCLSAGDQWQLTGALCFLFPKTRVQGGRLGCGTLRERWA
jgi:hypothetical protein